MDRLLLGKEIKRRRVELKLTQKQLASGICKQSIISKIENGDLFPSFEHFVALSNRLKTSVNYLLESAISDQYYYINHLKKKINAFIVKHKYDEAFIIADREIKTNSFLLGEHKDFFVWAHSISAFKTSRISSEECISILERCFSEKIDYINQNQKLINHNTIAILYSKNGDNERAFEEFERLLSEYRDKNDPFYSQVLFNYANILHSCNHVEKALSLVEEAISVCRKFDKVSMFGYFYFLKGECLIDLNYSRDEISQCFEKALFYFDLLHMDDYIQILWDRFYEYL